MSEAEKCKLCGVKKISHYGPGPRQRLGLYCYGSCHELREQVYAPAEPSPAPQAERVIEVAPQEEIPECWFDPEYFFNDLETANTKFRILAAALTTARAERDREAEYALKCDQLRWSAEKERDRAQAALRELDRYVRLGRGAIELGITEDGNIGIWLANEEKTLCKGDTVADAIAALKPVSDRQPEGETK